MSRYNWRISLNDQKRELVMTTDQVVIKFEKLVFKNCYFITFLLETVTFVSLDKL